MEWISDPTAWVGLATLILLEIVLGIDNLVFLAILSDKLPPHQRNRVRLVGLSLALIMRLALLASISWVATLTTPLFTVFGAEISGRDLIFIFGGLFLLFKATTELHERLEGTHAVKSGRVDNAAFWQVIAQIVVLDAVFSLDSIITAVGMVDELAVMMIAVVVAVVLMMVASRPLMNFVSAHPTVVILCLGFLLMVGFSLVVEGFGFHVPKGYLYAAIGFSILIEAFNQMARRNRERLLSTMDLRERTAAAVLRLLGGRPSTGLVPDEVAVLAEKAEAEAVFAPEEQAMIHSALGLADRSVRSIMTPRTEVVWLDVDKAPDELKRKILEAEHSRLPLARGSLDNFLGVALAKDLLHDLLEQGRINLERSVRQPLVVPESANVLRVMEQLRKSPLQMVVVLDEHGSFEGLVTPTDVLEAIATGFPNYEADGLTVRREEDGSWLVDGQMDIRRLSQLVGTDLVDDDDRYSTLAGFILWQLGYFPRPGEQVQSNGLCFKVISVNERRIDKVHITPLGSEGAGKADQSSIDAI